MEKLLDKISHYEIVNNIIPGAIYIFILKNYCGINLLTSEWFYDIIQFYFFGVVISRIGSVIIEPICKKIKLVKYCSHADYIIASKNDDLIVTMSTINNMYRSLCTVFFSSLITKLYIVEIHNHNISTDIARTILIIFLLATFLLAYRKQVKHITNRIYTAKEINTKLKGGN